MLPGCESTTRRVVTQGKQTTTNSVSSLFGARDNKRLKIMSEFRRLHRYPDHSSAWNMAGVCRCVSLQE